MKVLENLGLNKKEAKVYLACLELGSSTIQEIALKSGIKRTSIYNFIDKLIDFGLITKTQKANRYYFMAETPEMLKNVQEKNQQQLSLALPEMMKMFEVEKTQTNFKYFRGKEGAKKAWKDIINANNKTILFFVCNESSLDLVGVRVIEELIVELKNRGIKSKLLRQHGSVGKHKYFSKETLAAMNREARYLLPQVKIENSMIIYDNKVVTFAPLEENYGFIIESKSFANTMKSFHNALWEVSKLV